MIRSFASTCLLALALSACSSLDAEPAIGRIVPSTGIATSELRGSFRLSGERGEATVEAQAYFTVAATGDVVDLDASETVFCDGVPLERRSTIRVAELQRKAPGQTYRFELRRPGGSVFVDVAAIEPIAVAAPAAASTHRRGLELPVRYNAGTGRVDAQLLASCAAMNARGESAAGEVVLPPFVPAGEPGGPQNAAAPPCDGTLSVTRTRSEQVATALAATEAVAEEVDRIELRLVG